MTGNLLGGGFGPADLLKFAERKRARHDSDQDGVMGVGEVLGALARGPVLTLDDTDVLPIGTNHSPTQYSTSADVGFGPADLLRLAARTRAPHDGDRNQFLDLSEILRALVR